VPRDGHDLAFAGAEFGKARGGGLAKAVRRAMRQVRFVAALAEPVAEAVRRERFAEGRGEISQVAGARGVDDGFRFRPVIRVEDRDSYMKALEAASVDTDIKLFAEFLAERGSMVNETSCLTFRPRIQRVRKRIFAIVKNGVVLFKFVFNDVAAGIA
jgi:hypothetical protein